MHSQSNTNEDAQNLAPEATPTAAIIENPYSTDVSPQLDSKPDNNASAMQIELPPQSANQSFLISNMRVHKENIKIYGGNENIADLQKSIKANGVLEPLLITKDGQIIGGHRRFRAAQALQIKEVPVRVFNSTDEMDILNALLEHNRHRIKTKAQIAAEANLQMRIENERTKRQKTEKGKGENLPPSKKGKARDVVAEKLGISARTADKAAKVGGAINVLRSEGREGEAKELESALNKGYDTGHKLAVDKGHIQAAKPKAKNPVTASKAAPLAAVTGPQPAEKMASGPSAAQPLPAVSQPSANASDKALTYADHVITFLRGNEAKALSDQERRDWGKALDQIATCRKDLKF